MVEIMGLGEEFLRKINKAFFAYFSENIGNHRSPDDKAYSLDIKKAYSHDDEKADYWPLDVAPRSFGFPVLSVYENYNDARAQVKLVTSPYGEIPSVVAGSDRVVYYINNVYFFNSMGQAIKLEDIDIAVDLEGSLEDRIESLSGWGFSADVIQKLGFVPQADDTRFVSLSSEDYQKLRDFVNLLKDKPA